MRVRWAKEMPWRLYSHLDVVRAIERAIRRAGLPASYSEGFHPRLKLSFGPPLAFGLLSETEYFDLLLEEEYQHSDSAKLSRTFPEGLRFEEARGIAAGMPALSDTLNEAIYSAIIPMDLADAEGKLDEFHDREVVSWVRIGREDRRPIDPRKTLRHAIVEQLPEGVRWELSVVLGGEGNIRPTEWAMLLFGFSKEQLANIIITRTGLNIRRGSTVRTPFEPV
jgi:radical SAM-linked protein